MRYYIFKFDLNSEEDYNNSGGVNVREMKLSDVVEFNQGQNRTRLKNRHINEKFYDVKMFEEDSSLLTQYRQYKSINTLYVNEGVIIINPSLYKAAIVGEASNKYIYDNNFIQVKLTDSILDPLFFIYMFNEEPNIKRQLQSLTQGSNLIRLTVTSLSDLVIKIPDIEVQRKIGKIYVELKKLSYYTIKKKELTDKYFKNYLSKVLNKED